MPPGDELNAEEQRPNEDYDQALLFARDLARARAAAAAKHRSSEPSPLKLVMADDDDSLRRLVRTTLSGEGYEVIEATNGVEALAAVREHRPRLTLLDVDMPELSGLDVARVIKADASLSETWVVMLSGKIDPHDREKGLDAGADAYLNKPFGPLELLMVVEAAMGRS